MEKGHVCPECGEEAAPATISRREFLAVAGGAVIAATAAAAGVSATPAYATPRAALAPAVAKEAPESIVKTLYQSLTEQQKKLVAMPWSDPKRKMISANWAIVEPTIGKTFNHDQQDMIRAIMKGVTSEEWYPKFLAQMANDQPGGLDNYHVALFHTEGSDKYEWVLTGRHATMRCGGDPADNMAFGGPIFYGHAPKDTEDAGHPGNVFWHQAKRANEVFGMLDGKQRDQALIALAPEESAISFRKSPTELPGIPIGSLSKDQKEHVHQVMHDILAPYREKDVKDVLADLKKNGGLEALHLAFYKQDDLGNDGVWDIWRLEGPAFVWHFRGSPHVHTWVHIGASPSA